MPLSTQVFTYCFRRLDTMRVHVQPHMCMSSPTCILSFARQIANNERYSPVYKRPNRRFRSERGCPSHPVVGSKSFVYFLYRCIVLLLWPQMVALACRAQPASSSRLNRLPELHVLAKSGLRRHPHPPILPLQNL